MDNKKLITFLVENNNKNINRQFDIEIKESENDHSWILELAIINFSKEDNPNKGYIVKCLKQHSKGIERCYNEMVFNMFHFLMNSVND